MRRKESAVGLDVGRQTAKAVWVERAGTTLQITRTESLRLPPEAFKLGDALQPWAARHGIGRLPCALSIPGQHVVFHPVTIAPGDPREPDQIAGMQVLQITDMATEPMTHGYMVCEGRPGERRLLLGMARSAVVDGVLGVGRDLNLHVVNLLPSPLAAFCALHPRELASDGFVLLVDVGQSATGVVVGDAAGAVFARAFPIGGQTFTDALARALRMPVGQADNAKISAGDLRKEGAPETAPLQTAANAWISELQSSLSVYKNLFPAPAAYPRRLVLTGGGAELAGLPEYAGAKLGMPAARGALRVEPSGVEAPGRFAVAVGLALAALQQAGPVISLLPARVVDELMFRRQKPMWVAAATTGAMILAVSLVSGYRDIRRKEGELSVQRTSLAHRQELVAQIEKVRARTGVIQNMAGVLRREMRGGMRMRDLIELVARVKAPEDLITCVADAESYFARRAAGAPAAPPLPRGGTTPAADAESPFQRIMIEGRAQRSSLRTIRDLITTMKREPYITSADLLSDELVPDSPGDSAPRRGGAQRFVVDVRVAPP